MDFHQIPEKQYLPKHTQIEQEKEEIGRIYESIKLLKTKKAELKAKVTVADQQKQKAHESLQKMNFKLSKSKANVEKDK